ncbi:MAG: DUF3109 family protein [Porphyromonadaceae bacterium]|nr:MAG: DUF3109 family protein [Porphyromonadaceae bacterium]
MIEIGKAMVSFDVLQKKFCCNLDVCKGACCVHGDAGASLTLEEAGDLEDYLDELSSYISAEGLLSIIEQGAFTRDLEGEIVTPLINNKECAFTFFEDEIAFCAIEKAFRDGVVPFNKPVSCHLYPIRIKMFEEFEAVNYDEWDICNPARQEGSRNDLPVYQFVKEALIQKYGVEWFEQLDYAAKNLDFKKYD